MGACGAIRGEPLVCHAKGTHVKDDINVQRLPREGRHTPFCGGDSTGCLCSAEENHPIVERRGGLSMASSLLITPGTVRFGTKKKRWGKRLIKGEGAGSCNRN